MDAGQAAVIAGVGVLAGAANTIAGGGSFVTVPALLWTGMPAAVANGTNRIGVLATSLSAVGTYRHARVEGGDELLPQVLVACAGSLAGATLAVALPSRTLEAVFDGVMLALVGFALVRPRRWIEPGAPTRWRWPALLLTGVYGGFLQAGVGMLLLTCLVRLAGLDPVRASARKSLLVAALTVPALATFVAAGVVDWLPGVILAGGASVGGAVGARLTTRLGPRFVWGALLVLLVVTVGRKLL